MGGRGTVILALLVAAAGVFVWFDTSPSLPPGAGLAEATPAPPTPRLPPLVALRPREVTAVRLERGAERRNTQRVDATWSGSRRKGAIDDFLKNLVDLRILMQMPGGETHLQDYGLQPPRARIELTVRGTPSPIVLEIGDRNPATTGVYVRLGETGPVALAGALLEWEFEKAFAALGDAAATPAD